MIFKRSKKLNTPKKEKSNIFLTVKNTAFMFKYVFKYTPMFFWITVFVATTNAVWQVLSSIVYIKYIFDAIETGKAFKEIAIVTGVFALLIVVVNILNKWFWNVYIYRIQLKLQEGMQGELYMKARSLDQSCYDNPEFYNDFVWAIRESDGRVWSMMIDFENFLAGILSSVGVLSILWSMDKLVALICCTVSVVNLLFGMLRNKINYAKQQENQKIIRKGDYIKRVFYLAEYAKEIRQGNISEHLEEEYTAVLESKVSLIKRFAKKIVPLNVVSSLLTNKLLEFGVMGYLVVQYVVNPNVSLGSFSVGVTAVFNLYDRLTSITYFVTRFNEHSLYVEKFKKFLNYEPKVVSGIIPANDFESLELVDVKFSYNGEDDVIDNVNLKINKGEKIAFVGYNGAGKTTLIKVIMRLYDVTSGVVLYNGTDIKEYDLSSYRNKIGAVFQDHKLFAATVAENVLGDTVENESDYMTAKEALEIADFPIEQKLKNGLDTILTKEYSKEGTELSGGEQQKIAIARVFAKKCDLMILDEPSSALDPIAEYKLNQAITEKTKDKTVIFISHRLSTTRMADRIYMFDNGKIIEEGNHEELINKNGKYAEMFKIQAKKYENEKASKH
ncbi:MAG: ABC transporter ATP-binding protein [Ruminococcaceae bacterium]|nr:ABC transporter ATP-binding protein [Oscillospiraceae bacterium]